MEDKTKEKVAELLTKNGNINGLLKALEDQAMNVWKECEKGSDAEALMETIVITISAIRQIRKDELPVFNLEQMDDNRGLLHKPSGNEIRYYKFSDGYTVSFFENGECVASSTGLTLNVLALEIACWVRRGYKA